MYAVNKAGICANHAWRRVCSRDCLVRDRDCRRDLKVYEKVYEPNTDTMEEVIHTCERHLVPCPQIGSIPHLRG
jgi:hypothetical protein